MGTTLNTRSGDEFVVEPLVIPFTVVMLDVFRNSPAEMAFAEWDHSAETLSLIERTKRSA